MGKWYNKIFVGNPNKEDFTNKDLPKTRLEQFFDVVKLRFSSLITGNLIFALFAVPLMVFTLFLLFGINFAESSEIDFGVEFADHLNLFLLVAIPLYTIMGPATAGLYYCIRNWIWNERATIKEHFWKEFKRSFWKSIFINFFNALLMYAFVFWMDILVSNSAEYPIFKILQIVLLIVVVLYYMSSIYHYPQLVTYNLTLRQIFKNSFIYLTVQFPRTLLAVLAYLAIMLLTVLLSKVLAVVMICIGVSFTFLAQMILSDFIFDKYVNEPERQRKGMAPINKK